MTKYEIELKVNGLISRQVFLSIIVVVISLIFFQTADLSAAERTSYSVDTNKNDKLKVDIKFLLNQTVIKAPELVTSGEQTTLPIVDINNRIYIGDLASIQQVNSSTVSHSFSIFDANVELISDYDGDSYYHYFSVNFDADINFGSAIVYARMFISYEGGPWNHYYTTKTFELFENDKFDTHTVDTVFSTGYPPGSYDIRIDLYEAGWTGRVAVYGPNEDFDLNYLSLEDEEHDLTYNYNESYETVYSNGGCTLSASSKFDPVFPLMFLLSLFYFFKRFKLLKRKLSS
jgi:hypothetical protein